MPAPDSNRTEGPKSRESFSPAQIQAARNNTPPRSRAPRVGTETKRSEANVSNLSIRNERPAPVAEQAAGPTVCCSTNRSWLGQTCRLRRANGQLKQGERGQQWYGRPETCRIANKPCYFNGFGAVTGKRRGFESRSKGQGLARRPVLPKQHAGYKRRTLPEVVGLLE